MTEKHKATREVLHVYRNGKKAVVKHEKEEVQGDDVAETLLHVARSEGVTQLVIGASPRTWSGRSLVADLAECVEAATRIATFAQRLSNNS